VQNFYQLLSVQPTATPEEIKRAFRSEIARYHPDKVQHLGKEFQEIAASRAAALTEAYRTLMNADLRAEYDQLCGASVTAAPAAAPEQRGQSSSRSAPAPPRATEPPRSPANEPGYSLPPRFASERRDRDDFVRRATIERFRHALAAEVGPFDELPARGFDYDVATKAKLFSRGGGQRFAVKFVARVDKIAVQEAWNTAQKATVPICVFVMGNGIAPARELADAIADARKKSRGVGNIAIIPIDVRDWSAHLPADAPASCKSLLKRLRASSL
jgi:curved DNA-binding protein CbpA